MNCRCRGARHNWELPATFPSAAVVDAYRSPRVDANKNKFAFGRPDVELLRAFCRERFGWEGARVDELLLPVLQVRADGFCKYNCDHFWRFYSYDRSLILGMWSLGGRRASLSCCCRCCSWAVAAARCTVVIRGIVRLRVLGCQTFLIIAAV